MVEPMVRRSRAQVNDLGDLAKTILCLQRLGAEDVGVVTSFLLDAPFSQVGEADGEPVDTELARADREHHFVRIAGLITKE